MGFLCGVKDVQEPRCETRTKSVLWIFERNLWSSDHDAQRGHAEAHISWKSKVYVNDCRVMVNVQSAKRRWGEISAPIWGERSVRSNRTTWNIREVAERLKAPDMAILPPFYAGMAEK